MVFGIIAGVYVDRWDKRLVLVGSNLLRGGVSFAYVAFGAVAGLPLFALYAVNFTFQTIGQFFQPAEAAMIPGVVRQERLLQANSLFHLTSTASQLGGLVILGPILVKLIGLQGLFLVTATAITLCGLLVWPLPRLKTHTQGVAESGEAAVASIRQDTRVVFNFVLKDRIVALVMGQWTIGAILGLVMVTLLPNFAERLLNVRAQDAVFVMSPTGVGMVLGTILLNRFGSRLDRHYLTNVGLTVVTLSLVAIGGGAILAEWLANGPTPRMDFPGLGSVSSLVPFVMGLALIAGFGFVAIMVPTQTYLQEHVPPELRGRVFGVMFMLNNLANIPPLLLLGGLADLIGVEKTIVLIGLLIGAALLYSLRVAPGVAPWVKPHAERDGLPL